MRNTQGSVLGKVWFLIFSTKSEQLPQVAHVQVHAVSVPSSLHGDTDILQKTVGSISVLFLSVNLDIAADTARKGLGSLEHDCNCMLFSASKSKPHLSIVKNLETRGSPQ